MDNVQFNMFAEELLPNLPPVDTNILIAMENMQLVQAGLVQCTDAQLTAPETIEAFQQRLNTIGDVTGLTVPVLTEDTVVSTEGVVLTVITTIVKKIADFFRGIGKWLYKLLTGTTVTSKAQEASVKMAVNQAVSKANEQMKAQASTNTTTNDYIRITLPARSYCMFHTSRILPKVGQNYNAEGLKSAIDDIKNNYTTFSAAVREQINNLLETTDKLTYRLEGVVGPMPYSEIRQLRVKGKLYALAGSNYAMIGFKAVQKPMQEKNEFRETKVDLTNMVDQYGWSSDNGYTFGFHVTEVQQIGKKIQEQVVFVNKDVNSLIDKLNTSKIIKRLEFFKTPTEILGDDRIFAEANADNNLSVAHRQNIMHRLNVAYELALSLQMLIHTYSGFSQRYTAQLTALINAMNQAMD